MIKITGALIIIVSSCLIGFAVGEHEKEYINILLSLKRCLVIIKSEISYAYTPLIDIFVRISGMKQEEWSVFFDELSEEITQEVPGEKDMFNMWKKICETSVICKKITANDVAELIRFGGILGNTDREGQIDNIDMFLQSITERISASQKGISDKVRICRVLGVAAGFLITILLI